jgi:hypothetical protein
MVSGSPRAVVALAGVASTSALGPVGPPRPALPRPAPAAAPGRRLPTMVPPATHVATPVVPLAQRGP